MILPNPKYVVHKAWLYRLLSTIYDNQTLATMLYFKGGTCAAMLGFLDRFSIDLDFDFIGSSTDFKTAEKELELIFKKIGLEIKNKSKLTLQYFLKYPTSLGQRNTIKIDTTFPPPKANIYEPCQLRDIDRIAVCQTRETMFANKLVALIERWEKNNAIAGRDLYDIHHFFLQGFTYNKEVIAERRGQDVLPFLRQLIVFIKKNITETIINQDLNALLQPTKFQQIRKILKQETLMFLQDEVERGRNEAI